MNAKDEKTLQKILEHARGIVKETEDIGDAEAFRANDIQSKAALFDLLQIGELAKDGLSQDFVRGVPAIPWPQIYALRNRIVHGYASVDFQIIWEAISEDIPRLIQQIEGLLDD